MAHIVLYRTAQVAVNSPNQNESFDFTGAAVSVLAFSFASRGMATGDTLSYYADNGTGQWERGLGTWDGTTNSIHRTLVRSSSSGSSAVVWSSPPTVWSDGKQYEDDMSATEGTQNDIKVLTDTLVSVLSAMLEKMPRVTSTDQMAVSIEGTPTMNINSNQTLATLTNVAQIGGKDALTTAISQVMSGTRHIYSNITVT